MNKYSAFIVCISILLVFKRKDVESYNVDSGIYG